MGNCFSPALPNLRSLEGNFCSSPLYSNHLKTGQVWYSNGRCVSGCQMVRYSNGGLKTGLKKSVVYVPKCLVFEWSPKSHDFTIRIPETHTVQYSDDSSIQVFSIQMVTV